MEVACCRGKSEIEAEFIQHGLQIINMQLRGVVSSAAYAAGRPACASCFSIKGDSERKRALNDVKQLPEGKVEQQPDDACGVGHSDELKSGTRQKLRAHGEHAAADALPDACPFSFADISGAWLPDEPQKP